ncbi:MAG: DUF4406 domain-containing protein [Rhodoferax sp.]|jgi:hypothetical protein
MIPLLYLAGPMTGLPEYNYPLFNSTTQRMRSAGFTVVNPAENGLPASAPWAAHMRRDLHSMLDCQGVALLPGWEESKGARLEVDIARALGMPVQTVDEWMQISLFEPATP